MDYCVLLNIENQFLIVGMLVCRAIGLSDSCAAGLLGCAVIKTSPLCVMI